MYNPPLIRSWTKKMAGAKAETIAMLRLFVRAARSNKAGLRAAHSLSCGVCKKNQP